jgi:hypothetical protein
MVVSFAIPEGWAQGASRDTRYLTNEYSNDGYIKRETMKDGRQFSYFYFRDGFVLPNG